MAKDFINDKNALIITSSPQIRGGRFNVNTIMLNVLIALLPATIASVVFFGIRALLICLFCVAVSVGMEFIYKHFMKQRQTITDGSAAVTGLLLALNLPSTTPYWIALIGCFFAVIVTKQLFGGIGKNFANPAIVGRVVLLISFGSQLSNFKANNFEVDTSTYATPLIKEFANKSYLDMFIGNRGGSIGETCILALLIGFAYLLFKKIITPSVPVSYMVTVVIVSLIMRKDPLYQLMGGGIVLGAVFMATDYVTSPSTEIGKIIFGVGIGVINMLIRHFSFYPEGTSFAILFMNIWVPHIERLTRPRAFGEVKAGGTNNGEI